MLAYMNKLFKFILFTGPLAALASCGKEEIKTYRLAKDADSMLTPANPHAEAMSPHSGMPMGDGAMKGMPAMERSDDGARLNWDIPAGWTEQPASGMRLASFSVAGKNGMAADASVIHLTGSAGGILANVNRWRDQAELGPIDENGLARMAEKMKSMAGTATVVDFVSQKSLINGTHKFRILAAILEDKSGIWFFKMTGEDSVVREAKPAFLKFLKSLRKQ